MTAGQLTCAERRSCLLFSIVYIKAPPTATSPSASSLPADCRGQATQTQDAQSVLHVTDRFQHACRPLPSSAAAGGQPDKGRQFLGDSRKYNEEESKPR